MTDKDCLPLVLNNRSNLLAHSTVANLNPLPNKHSHEIRIRGSMFASMLNNIKHCIINKSKADKKNKNEYDKENQKISLQVKNYYTTKKSHDNYMRFSNSIQIKQQKPFSYHSGKAFIIRDFSSKKTMPISQMEQLSKQVKSIQILPKKITIKLSEKHWQAIKMESRRQFLELPYPHSSLIIHHQLFIANRHKDKMFESLLSEILAEGIDPYIRLDSSEDKFGLPTYLRDLCHIIYPIAASKYVTTYKFIKLHENLFKNSEQNSNSINKSNFMANRILFVEPLRQNFTSKWYFSSDYVNISTAYIKISDLKTIRQIKKIPFKQNLTVIYESTAKQQIGTYEPQKDRVLAQNIRFLEQSCMKDVQIVKNQEKLKKTASLQQTNRSNYNFLHGRLCTYVKDLILQKSAHNKQTANNKCNSIFIQSGKSFKARFSYPDRQAKSHIQQQDLSMLNQIMGNPKRLPTLNNATMIVGQLCRNNTHISNQIGEYLCGAQNVRLMNNCIKQLDSNVQMGKVDCTQIVSINNDNISQQI